MSLSDVFKKITPCDRQKPYIFISYSSNDKELVWQDALEFQRQGYNIWLDEKNIDKTKASWKEDALLAIQDMYCVLVVFYVSKSSLTSESCYNELAKTVDELTVALHLGPVKFIAVDVDEVGNIVEFSRNLYQEIFSTEGLSKDAKSKMMLTMHKFMKEFFDSNNEKVRIHPKNEPNRKMNYYEEIMAAFPDEACDTALKDENVKGADLNKIQAEAEAAARAKLEEELKLLKQQVSQSQEQTEPKAEATPSKANGEPKVDFAAAVAALEAKKKMDEAMSMKGEAKKENVPRQLTREQIEKAMAKANESIGAGSKFMTVAAAGETKIKNALKAYAKSAEMSSVVGILDTTVFGSAKDGFLITFDALYSDGYKKQFIDLKRLKSFRTGKNSYDFVVTYMDGKEETFFIATVYQGKIKDFLTQLLLLCDGSK